MPLGVPGRFADRLTRGPGVSRFPGGIVLDALRAGRYTDDRDRANTEFHHGACRRDRRRHGSPCQEVVMDAVTDASHLYEVERRARHLERPGFRISELQIGPTQSVPWHFHSNIQDTFYVIEGRLRLFLREPVEDVRLGPGDTYSVRARRPHLVTNAGDTSATFLVLQGVGEYDYVPLV